MEKLFEYATYLAIFSLLAFVILECLGVTGKKKKDSGRSVLYYPTMSENGVEPEEVFKSLEESNIKPNYLGMED